MNRSHIAIAVITAATASVAALPLAVHAQTVRVGTALGNPDSSIGFLNSLVYANQFTVASSPFTIGTATLRLSASSGSANPFSVFIQSDASGKPSGTTVVTFGPQAVGTTVGNVTFTPTTTATLQANTTYWIFPQTASDNVSGNWFFTRTSTGDTNLGNDGMVVNAVDSSNTSGVSWNTFASNLRTQFQITDVQQQGGGAVPEPGEWAFYGILGVGVVGLFIRKRMNDVVRAKRRIA